MSRIVQEKFEVRPEQKPEGTEGGGWVSDKRARGAHGMQTRDRMSGKFEPYHGDMLNTLPPGSDIDDQEFLDEGPQRMAETFNGTQATNDVTPTSLRTGFDRKMLRPTDDMYTREHNDAFYDTVEVDGVEGFVERNNYLDRL
jgi:hypothetical protein